GRPQAGGPHAAAGAVPAPGRTVAQRLEEGHWAGAVLAEPDGAANAEVGRAGALPAGGHRHEPGPAGPGAPGNRPGVGFLAQAGAGGPGRNRRADTVSPFEVARAPEGDRLLGRGRFRRRADRLGPPVAAGEPQPRNGEDHRRWSAPAGRVSRAAVGGAGPEL